MAAGAKASMDSLRVRFAHWLFAFYGILDAANRILHLACGFIGGAFAL
jgi:hypothetical protein